MLFYSPSTPQIITLTLGFGGSGSRENCGSWQILCRVWKPGPPLSFWGPLSLWGSPHGLSDESSGCPSACASAPMGGEGEGLLSGLAPLTTHHDLRFQPGSSPQPTNTCRPWAPGPSSVPGGGLSAAACCQDPDSSSLLLYRSAHTPASSVSWNLLKSLSHCWED